MGKSKAAGLPNPSVSRVFALDYSPKKNIQSRERESQREENLLGCALYRVVLNKSLLNFNGEL